MLLGWLLAPAALAGSDVGTEHTFGLGVASGPALATVTGKLWVSPKGGFVFYAGTSGLYHAARVGWQGGIKNWGQDWSWGQLHFYWHVDADVGFWTAPGVYTGAKVGAGGGVGLAAQFQKIPLEVFGEGGLAITPVNGYCVQTLNDAGLGAASAACWVGGLGAAGVRWYF